MLADLLIRDVNELDHYEMAEECAELEDAYAEALKDDAGFDALNKLWKRIQELHSALKQVP
jgi:hypothetical protein